MRILWIGLLAALSHFASVDEALAYPHFQLSSDTSSCNQCHYAPAGGGILTGWGRLESADTLSRGGDGRFLHGTVPLPDLLAVGGDLRLAALANDTGSTEGAALAAFPMQADVAARVAAGDWSVVGSVGLRGAVRSGAPTQDDNSASEVPSTSWTNRLVSREHYVHWRPEGARGYVRVGRFFAPFGLRLADHTSYIRRYAGFNLLEETYGASGGWLANTWEAHVTAFVSDRARGAARKEIGATAMLELRQEASVLGISGRVGSSDADVRSTGGLYGKWWWAGPRILWQAELDGVHQRFEAGGRRLQLIGYLGPTWIPTRGLYVGAAYEIFDEDVVARYVERHAVGMWTAYHPWAHVEIMISGRAQRIGTSDHAYTGLAQVHYYL